MTVSCSECGHDFELNDSEEAICPHCGSKIRNNDDHTVELADALLGIVFNLDDITPIDSNNAVKNKLTPKINIDKKKIRTDHNNQGIVSINTTVDSEIQPHDDASNSFFSTPAWFFLAVLTFLVNIILIGIIFWQRLQLDVIVNKLIGEV